MTRKQILDLRPVFVYGKMEMVEWFSITEAATGFTIKSGLRNANNDIKTPYYYNSSSFGKKAEEIELKKFTEWWNNLDL